MITIKKQIKLLPLFLLVLMSSFSLFFVAQPQFAHAEYKGLVQCDGVPDAAKGEVKCDFVALINQIKFLINWAFYIAVPVAVGFFAYAGILRMTGTEGNIKTSREIFWTVGKGFLIMASAWFIVYTILTWLTKTSDYTSLLQ